MKPQCFHPEHLARAEPQKSRKLGPNVHPGISAVRARFYPFGRGPGALSMTRRANRAALERMPGEHDGPTGQPGQGDRRGAEARAAPQAVGAIRHLLHRGGRPHHRRHRRLQVLRAPPHPGRRGGRRPLHRSGSGSGAGQEGRGAEGSGGDRQQRALRAIPRSRACGWPRPTARPARRRRRRPRSRQSPRKAGSTRCWPITPSCRRPC